jgi:peptidoglycan/LPS O-acetylase OafA/YrhL
MGGSRHTDQRVGPEVVQDKTRTAFLDIARGLAAILVVYTHIYDVYILDFKGVHTPPTDAIDNAFVFPLKLDDQGIGAVSVPIFFIISGFVVTPIALKMGARRFSINRVFRVYPLLIFVVSVSAVLIALGLGLLSTKPPDVNVWTFLSNASLWNFIDRPFGSWVAVAWTLAVEVLFYATLVAVLPLMRRRMWLAIAVELWVVLMLLITYRAFADEYRAFVINMVYVLVPIMGQAIWAAWTGRIPAWLAGVFVTAAWLMFVWAGHLNVDPEYIPRPFPIAFAMMLFLIGLFAEPYLRQRRFWTELSERTYSIYLLHGSVAFPLMHWLFDRLPLWLTVLIAVAATGLAAEVSYRFVERPSHNLARRLSRREVKAPEPEPEPEEDEESPEDRPTETIRAVAPRRAPVRVPMKRPAEPITRSRRHDAEPVRRTAGRLDWPEQDERRPAARHGIHPRTNGHREHAWPESEDVPNHEENGAPRANRGMLDDDRQAANGVPRRARPAHDEIERATNGVLHASRDVPAHDENGRATNGTPRRASREMPAYDDNERSSNGVPRAGRAAAGSRRASAPVIWPDDQDEQDEPPRPGRHRRD